MAKSFWNTFRDCLSRVIQNAQEHSYCPKCYSNPPIPAFIAANATRLLVISTCFVLRTGNRNYRHQTLLESCQEYSTTSTVIFQTPPACGRVGRRTSSHTWDNMKLQHRWVDPLLRHFMGFKCGMLVVSNTGLPCLAYHAKSNSQQLLHCPYGPMRASFTLTTEVTYIGHS
jgi:hypothetical protein